MPLALRLELLTPAEMARADAAAGALGHAVAGLMAAAGAAEPPVFKYLARAAENTSTKISARRKQINM